jgi:hypothetical protein
MRIALITFLLLPYLYFGGKDHAYHFTARRVPVVEHLLHLFIGMTVVAGIVNAYRGRTVHFVAAIALFLVVGGLDEYVYHRRLPQQESELHAKGHLALLIFVVGTLATNWLGTHHWQLSNAN